MFNFESGLSASACEDLDIYKLDQYKDLGSTQKVAGVGEALG